MQTATKINNKISSKIEQQAVAAKSSYQVADKVTDNHYRCCMTDDEIFKSLQQVFKLLKATLNGHVNIVAFTNGAEYSRPHSEQVDYHNYQALVALIQSIIITQLSCARLLVVGKNSELIDERPPANALSDLCFLDSCIGFEKSLTKVLPNTQFAVLQLNHAVLDNNEFDKNDLDKNELDNQVGPLDYSIIWHELVTENFVSIQYHAGQRYIRQLEKLNLNQTSYLSQPDYQESTRHSNLSEPHALQTVFKKRGTYLITGATGGIGQAIASYLATEYSANLILIGRSKPSQATVALEKQLTELGAVARYYQANVADQLQLEQVIANSVTEFTGIDGVLHLAGTQNYQSIATSSWAEFAAVLDAKVAGTIYLAQAFTTTKLDFFCCFSSSAAMLGDFGACNYAVANRFQGAFSQLCNHSSAESSQPIINTKRCPCSSLASMG